MSGIFREGTPPPSSPDPEEHRGDPSVCPSGPSCPMPPPPATCIIPTLEMGVQDPPTQTHIPTSPRSPTLPGAPTHTQGTQVCVPLLSPRGPKCLGFPPCFPRGHKAPPHSPEGPP